MNSYSVTRRSPLTGISTTFDIPLSPSDFLDAYHNWKDGMLIQHAFPTLTPNQREFLMTGYTPEDWDKLFGHDAQ
jgi:hypothetical protein